MVVVFDHHGSEILFPPRTEILVRIVVGVFMHQPVVAEFIHDIHTQLVTGIQQGFGRRVMGGTYRVEAGLLEQPDAAEFSSFKGARAQNTVVVVDAGAAKQRLLPIHEEALDVPAEGAETKPLLRRVHHLAVLQQLRPAQIQLGVVCVPKPGLGNGDVHGSCPVLYRRLGLRRDASAVQDGNPNRVAAGDRRLHMGRVVPRGGDQQAVGDDMAPIPKEKVYVPIDPAPGIPAGIGHR